MSKLFLNIFNMSISAGWIVLAVLILRLLLKKAPKWITVLLWGIVAFRLVCPFSFESILSIIPSAQTIPTNIITSKTPNIDSGIPFINNTINPIITDNFTPALENGANPLQVIIFVISIIWLMGVFAILIYSFISYIRLYKQVKTAVLLRDNIYQSETVASPFVLGIIKPKIYLPFSIGDREMDYVIAHEQGHLKRKDHIWKPFGFLILTVYWFNPLLWLGYILFCRDIELACDEKVIINLDTIQKADYSEALLNCSIKRRLISACPLAFGEVGVKQRIKTVLNYKKPAASIVVIAVFSVILSSACLLTNPPKTALVVSNNNVSLLSTLIGSNDISSIQGFEIIHKYGDVTTEIANKNDISFLKEYTYSHDYPQDELHKLFSFPENQIIKVMDTDGNYRSIYLMSDGSMVVQTIKGDAEISYGVYTAENKYMLNEEALIKLLKKYGGYKIS